MTKLSSGIEPNAFNVQESIAKALDKHPDGLGYMPIVIQVSEPALTVIIELMYMRTNGHVHVNNTGEGGRAIWSLTPRGRAFWLKQPCSPSEDRMPGKDMSR